MIINLHIVNNDGMKIFNLQNKLLNSLMLPFILGSAILTAAELISLSNSYISNGFTDILYSFTDTLTALLGYIFCYFPVLMLTKGKSSIKAFVSLLCIALFNCAFDYVGNSEPSYLLSLILGCIFVFCFNKLGKSLSYVIVPVISLLLGYASGFLSNELEELIFSFSNSFFSGNVISAALFGGINSVFSLFNSPLFSDLLFYKSAGGSLLYNEQLLTGVKDLFENGYTGNLVSAFLSGKYYLIFALTGLAVSVSNELKGIQRGAILVVCVSALISGNLSLLILFLILENVLMIVPIILLSMLSYASAALLKLGMGYLGSGGIIELAMSLNGRWVYLLAGSAVLAVMGYFCGKYFVEKNGISDCLNIYIPTRLNSVLKSLGGIENIIRIKNGNVEVRNPQLVNFLNDEYEIKDNIIICNSRLISELGEYLE